MGSTRSAYQAAVMILSLGDGRPSSRYICVSVEKLLKKSAVLLTVGKQMVEPVNKL